MTEKKVLELKKWLQRDIMTEKNNYIFVGNTKIGRDLSYLKGIEYRIGEQAFDIHEKKIDTNYMRPLFIKKQDYYKYNRMMMHYFNKKLKNA